MSTLDDALDNLQADSWSDVNDEEYVYDDETVPALERLQSYVDYCFDTWPIVSDNLDRDDIQCCIANWDRRRGQHRANKRMDKREFGKQVRPTHERRVSGSHVVFISKPLIGVPPEDDGGAGWKACVRHELGHAIDHRRRGTSDHSKKFKKVMRQFGEDNNDGMYSHGYYPSFHR